MKLRPISAAAIAVTLGLAVAGASAFSLPAWMTGTAG